ncbi:MAG: threonylcarbamoyl-AMP synthase [Candidatus Doudnabacteria bacterium CG10_big_fil_rev_8_21_14_0_10_41_10]|uniref:L-threonylcarbamoyladenylate synthase n=1 Tax=Candidatus Doudnabacteria bacterium CG10_big_fil_rev_8_21_14_0_10_41_10 TaxID=1974551 RepID=A0A2H0VDF1_9BACT|nr:MAG: threonylcarbamoyl-AMP synthase [Candidatus Doudnabacteria bacterium CG10_big_fil_rev_8_21_14_0_10_41_10]
MRIIKADEKGINLAVKYLKAGKSVVYPTDTSSGLAVDATNVNALKKIYRIKRKKINSIPMHIVVSSMAQAKKYGVFSETAEKLFKKFLPGPLTLIVESRISKLEFGKILAGKTGTIGIRMPKNNIALALVKKLGRPITATSANPSHKHGGHDSYTANEVINQFKNRKDKPDLVLDAGRLKKVKPSTMLEVKGRNVKIIRKGPVGKIAILKLLRM